MVSLSGILPLVPDANRAMLNSSGTSSAVPTSPAQLEDDTYTPSGENGQRVKSGSGSSFAIDSSIANPFYASNVQLEGSIEKSGSNEVATLNVSGETSGVDCIIEYSHGLFGSTTTIYPFEASSSTFNLSITASVSGSSAEVDASLTTSHIESYAGVTRQDEAAMEASFSASYGKLVDAARPADQAAGVS